MKKGSKKRTEEAHFHVTGEITIEIPALRRPTLDDIRRYHRNATAITSDRSPEEPVTLTLAMVHSLDSEEETPTGRKDSIDGAEFQRRLAAVPNALLGYQHREWLFDCQGDLGLARIPGRFGISHITFPGIVIATDIDDGNCFYPAMYHFLSGVNQWRRGSSWIGDGVTGWDRIAVVK